MRKRKNKIFATPADATAIPENPKIAAAIATMKKITAQFSICLPSPLEKNANGAPSPQIAWFERVSRSSGEKSTSPHKIFPLVPEGNRDMSAWKRYIYVVHLKRTAGCSNRFKCQHEF